MNTLREIDKQRYRNLNHSFIPNQVWQALSEAQQSAVHQLAVKYGGYTPKVVDLAKEMYEKITAQKENTVKKSLGKTGKRVSIKAEAKAKAHRRIARE